MAQNSCLSMPWAKHSARADYCVHQMRMRVRMRSRVRVRIRNFTNSVGYTKYADAGADAGQLGTRNENSQMFYSFQMHEGT